MAWNEPGNSGDKDPWGGRRQDQGPPDLDEIVKKMQDKVSGLFKGKGGGTSGAGKGASSGAIGIVLVIALGIWGLSGIYIIDPAERGVVMRFGQFVDTTMPGPHWHMPYPIEKVDVVNVDEIRNVEIGFRAAARNQAGGSVPSESLMLTQDENIVDIKFAVQYRIKDAKDYLFNVRDPDLTLRQATESAIREVIGKSRMDFILTQGRSEIAERVETLLQEILDRYSTGLHVTSVNMQSAQPPREVQAAFDDAIKAREDEQRLKNEAEAYSNDIIPRARGSAARILEEANGYKERVIARAEGDAARFSHLVAEYKKAPQVTRERLYLDAMESVMSKTSKVLVDVSKGSNLLYLPLDKLMPQAVQGKTIRSAPTDFGTDTFDSRPLDRARERENLRSRGRP